MEDRDTVFFDLDGTLLPIDIEEFLQRYFRLLTEEFSDLDRPGVLIEKLKAATREMLNNNGEKTNKEVFINSFFELVEVDDIDRTMERFNLFYREKFPLLRKGLNLHTKARELIDIFNNKGYNLILATNPLFPEIAIVERMHWAGLKPEDFDYITSYEKMHYSKPNLEFYRELLTRLNLNAEQCIMIGNDVQEDLIAGKLGFATYLIEDFKIDRKDEDINCDWQGSFEDLIEFWK